jgi:hypothetical protein
MGVDFRELDQATLANKARDIATWPATWPLRPSLKRRMVSPSVPCSVTASRTSITFTQCKVIQPVTFSSNQAGDYPINMIVSGSGAGTYTFNSANSYAVGGRRVEGNCSGPSMKKLVNRPSLHSPPPTARKPFGHPSIRARLALGQTTHFTYGTRGSLALYVGPCMWGLPTEPKSRRGQPGSEGVVCSSSAHVGRSFEHST